jgi:hypothetical protein
LALPIFFVPQLKTKQIPDDFRNWIEARTFEFCCANRIAAPVARGLFEAGY